MRRSYKKSGQVVTEYILILTFVVIAISTTKIKIDAVGNIDFSGTKTDSKTVLELMSRSFTVWMEDILVVIALPS